MADNDISLCELIWIFGYTYLYSGVA